MLILEEKLNLNSPVCAAQNGLLDSNLDIVPNGTIIRKYRFLIYLVTNTINNKLYIGRTYQKLNHRWNNHTAKSKHNRKHQLIDRAIKKHGKENFKCELLFECESFAEMKRIETALIILFNTLSPNGYNLILGDKFYEEGPRITSSSTREKLALSTHRRIQLTDRNFRCVKKDKNSFNVRIIYKNQEVSKYFDKEEDAAEFADIFNYFRFRENALLNFPDRIETYKIKIKSKKYLNTLAVHATFSSNYKGVCFDKNQKVYRSHVILTKGKFKKRQLYLGQSEIETEAAILYDKICYFLYNDVSRLNFPNKLCEYLKEDLESLYNKLNNKTAALTKKTSIYRGVYRRITPSGKIRWYVQVRHMDKLICSPTFYLEEDAARFYDKHTIQFLGDKAKTNFPKSNYLI